MNLKQAQKLWEQNKISSVKLLRVDRMETSEEYLDELKARFQAEARQRTAKRTQEGRDRVSQE